MRIAAVKLQTNIIPTAYIASSIESTTAPLINSFRAYRKAYLGLIYRKVKG